MADIEWNTNINRKVNYFDALKLRSRCNIFTKECQNLYQIIKYALKSFLN